MEQITLFDYYRKPVSINKPIRLIELFAGYGSQAMALKRIGANFEHYKVVEFDKYAIASYNAVHTVYDENALCPNITTIDGGGTQQIKVLTETTCVAMRGRNPDNPSDRTAGSPTEQRLEMNTQGTSNCLTSVRKDNLVMETVRIKQATKDGYAECEVGGVFDASFPSSSTRRGRVQGKGNIAPTLTTQEQEIYHIQPNYRIRKLTPRECGRLMGVSDDDISKMAAVNSNTQLYKQFGNSIVVDVMVAMFKNLNIDQKGVEND